MMGKQSGKKKKKQSGGGKSGDSNAKQIKVREHSSRAYDEDTAIFISMSQELKDEGNKLFQKRDCEGAMLKYEKAMKLLPRNHIDVSYLHSNIAACYMQMGLSEYPRAIHECNLALEVSPKYSKALLKRARCYEALNRLDLALRDVTTVLTMEPNNLMAIEISDRVKMTMDRNGAWTSDIPVGMISVPDYIKPSFASNPTKVLKEKIQSKKMNKIEERKEDNKDQTQDREKKAIHEIRETNAENNEEDETEGKNVGDENETQVIEEKVEHEIETINSENKLEETKAENKKEDEAEEKNIDEKNQDDKNDSQEEKVELRIEKIETENKIKEENVDKIDEKKAEDKLVVEEKINSNSGKDPTRTVKLVFGEDIRWAQIPINCSILRLREIISDRYPSSKAVLIKYRDLEGDMVTITTNEELRWAEAAAEHGSVRLYIVGVNPEQDPFYKKVNVEEEVHELGMKQNKIAENGNLRTNNELFGRSSCINDWIIQFADLFKNYVGFDADAYLDMHEVGMKLYLEALEEAVTSEEAQDVFCMAAEKFQEMAALALFNWGNVHMSRARKRVYFMEDASRESVMAQIKSGYEWSQKEYSEAGEKYKEALVIKPDSYEAILALGQQQFEQAKLSWYYAIGTNVDLETWPYTEVLQLYNNAEENMERGMLMWEEAEQQRLNDIRNLRENKTLLQRMKLDNMFRDITEEEAAEQAANMRSQINVLWGAMLYERSMMEFKLGLPVWHECLEVSVEKFELAGASETDIAVMIKNHCSNNNAMEGLGFNIDEIIQAWNEMYEARRWQRGIPSLRLEPLLRRRVSKLYYALEHA